MEHLKIPAHGISIHALLAESDISVFWTALSRPLFLSTLSLRRATGCVAGNWPRGIFLSTLSLRRATPSIPLEMTADMRFLSTLSLRRATGYEPEHYLDMLISIHALLAESDLRSVSFLATSHTFLSTLSLRRATDTTNICRTTAKFLSTLSLRRATVYMFPIICTMPHFYPRSPCGERLC